MMTSEVRDQRSMDEWKREGISEWPLSPFNTRTIGRSQTKKQLCYRENEEREEMEWAVQKGENNRRSRSRI